MNEYKTLGDLIDFLKSCDPKNVVNNGFSRPHCDRGCYDHLAFDPSDFTSIGEMLEEANYALGGTFYGWKGGEYTMWYNTIVKIGRDGETGTYMTQELFDSWL